MYTAPMAVVLSVPRQRCLSLSHSLPEPSALQQGADHGRLASLYVLQYNPPPRCSYATKGLTGREREGRRPRVRRGARAAPSAPQRSAAVPGRGAARRTVPAMATLPPTLLCVLYGITCLATLLLVKDALEALAEVRQRQKGDVLRLR